MQDHEKKSIYLLLHASVVLVHSTYGGMELFTVACRIGLSPISTRSRDMDSVARAHDAFRSAATTTCVALPEWTAVRLTQARRSVAIANGPLALATKSAEDKADVVRTLKSLKCCEPVSYAISSYCHCLSRHVVEYLQYVHTYDTSGIEQQ
jgi:hypothetical protein